MPSAPSRPTAEELCHTLQKDGYDCCTGLSTTPSLIATGVRILCECESHLAQLEEDSCDGLPYQKITVLAPPSWVVNVLSRVSAAYRHDKDTDKYTFALAPVIAKSSLRAFPEKSSVLDDGRSIQFKYALSHDLDLTKCPPRPRIDTQSSVQTIPPVLIGVRKPSDEAQYPSVHDWIAGSSAHCGIFPEPYLSEDEKKKLISGYRRSHYEHSIFIPPGDFDWPGALEETRRKSQENDPMFGGLVPLPGGLASLEGTPEEWSKPVTSFLQVLTLDATGICWLDDVTDIIRPSAQITPVSVSRFRPTT